ncbi:MAG TPA: hypothetical protein VIM56_12960 [Rhizomicrobium sp.]
MRAASSVILFLLSATASASAQSFTDENVWSPPTMDCSVGPIAKTYGAQSWLVFGCADGKSVQVVSTLGSPSSPAYFMFEYGEKGYGLYGQGMGDRDATDAAHAELGALKNADIAALYEETRSAAAAQKSE